jgi:hypothetical protein
MPSLCLATFVFFFAIIVVTAFRRQRVLVKQRFVV